MDQTKNQQQSSTMGDGTFSLTQLNESFSKKFESFKNERELNLAAQTSAIEDDSAKTVEKEDESEEKLDIMMLLDTNKITSLRKDFEKEEEGLTTADFVYVMKKYLKSSTLDETQIVANLCELFAQIDVNGDGTMEWDEFTSYIVDTGNKVGENDPNGIYPYFANSWEDDSKHSSTIEHIYYFEQPDKIALCEQGSKSLRLYSPYCQPLNNIQREEGSVLCADYASRYSSYVISSSDLAITCYDDQYYRITKTLQTPTAQTCLRWAESAKTLFSSGINGIVHAWDLDQQILKHSMGGPGRDGYLLPDSHEDMVLDLLHIDTLENIVSASMDRTIKLWDAQTGKHKKMLEGHSKGVRSLAYSQEYRFLISAGFDYDALVWNPYVEHLILRLHGHSAPLCNVEVVQGTPQIVTADTTGVFKIWDIRNFICVHTFSAYSDQIKDFTSVTTQKEIVGAGRRLHRFSYNQRENPALTDDNPVCGALYNPTSATFISSSGREIKLWDAKSGAMMKSFRNPAGTTDVTAICLDDRERKFAIGTHAGSLEVFDYINGSQMKECEEITEFNGKNEISQIVYCDKHKIIISVGWDGNVTLYDEMDPDTIPIIRQVKFAHRGGETTCVDYSYRLSLIVSGSFNTDIPLIVWDFEFLRMEGILAYEVITSQAPKMPFPPSLSSKSKNKSSFNKSRGRSRKNSFSATQNGLPATAVSFHDEYFPGVISADSHGNICIWVVSPAPEHLRFRLLALLKNPTQGASVLVIKPHEKEFFTGDDKGYITKWDLSELIVKVKEEGCVLPEIVECENPRRVMRSSNLTNSRDFHYRNESPLYKSAIVKQVKSWRAHKDCVNGIQVIETPPSLLTCSSDCTARVWDLSGKPLGTLKQGEKYGDKNWLFKIDTVARRKEQLKNARDVMDEISKDSKYQVNPEGVENESSEDEDENEMNALLVNNYSVGTIDSTPYERKTPRLKPVKPGNAGKGMSNTPKGRRVRSIAK